MRPVANRLTDSLIAGEIISPEDRELYVYGFHQGFVFLFNLLTMCLIGYINGMLTESVIFLLAYMPLRSYAGGYHAKTPLRCYLLSILMMIFVLSVIRSPFWDAPAAIAVLSLATAMILALSPVEDPNKPLTAKEITVYRKRTMFILVGLIAVGIVLWLVGQESLSACIIAALATLALMLIAGKVKNARISKG